MIAFVALFSDRDNLATASIDGGTGRSLREPDTAPPTTNRKHITPFTDDDPGDCNQEGSRDNMLSRRSDMVQAYPRRTNGHQPLPQLDATFKQEIASLTDDYFPGRPDKALAFVEKSFRKYVEHNKEKKTEPKFIWAPAKFFSDWVRKEHDLKRTIRNIREREPAARAPAQRPCPSKYC